MRWRTTSRLLIGATVMLAVVLAGLFTVLPRHDSAPTVSLAGTILNSAPAPNFQLKDQFDHSISLQQFRGRVVIVTFFYTHCPDTCPLTAEKLRLVMRELGQQSHDVVVIAISTDPLHDTPALARRFLRLHGILHGWHFLLGTPRELAPIWSAYHIYVGNPEATGGPTHTAGMYLIDQRGRERAYLDDSLPAPAILTDLQILLGDTGAAHPPTAPQVGAAAPDFTLPSLNGGSVHLRQFRGKVILLNFWATWCGPCRSELPRLERAYRRFARHGLIVIGVDQQEIRSAVRDFVITHHVTYPIALDQNGTVAYEYQLQGIPTSFFIDRQGVIRFIALGSVSTKLLQTQLKELGVLSATM
jgi:protein SCO1/2